MPLLDCTVTDTFEVVENFGAPVVTITGGTGTKDGISVPQISATWTPTSDPYVTSLQFEFQRANLAAGPTLSEPVPKGRLSWVDPRVIAGETYLATWRVVGEGRVGAWSTPPVSVLIPATFTAGDVKAVDGMAAAELRQRLLNAAGGLEAHEADLARLEQARALLDSRVKTARSELDKAAEAVLSAALAEVKSRSELGERVDKEQTARTLLAVAVDNNVAALLFEQQARVSAIEAEAGQRLAIALRVEQTEADLLVEAEVRATAIEAEATLRQAIGLRVDQAELDILNEVDARIAADSVEASARTLLAGRVGNAETAILDEATIRLTEDTALANVLSLVGAKTPDGSAFMMDEVTLKLTPTESLADRFQAIQLSFDATDTTIEIDAKFTAQAGPSGAIAQQVNQLRLEVADQYATIQETSTLESDLTGIIAAKKTLTINVNNQITGWEADGIARSFTVLSDYFSVVSLTGNGMSYSAVTGRLKLVTGTRKVVLAAGGNLALWAGPTSVADGGETVNNGTLGISSEDAFFGGRTLAGFFSIAQTAGVETALTTSWQTIISVDHTTRLGWYDLFLDFQGRATAPPLDPQLGIPGSPQIEYRLISTFPDGSDAVIITSGVVGTPPDNAYGSFLPVERFGHNNNRSAMRRIHAQFRIQPETTAGAVKAALLEFYYLV